MESFVVGWDLYKECYAALDFHQWMWNETQRGPSSKNMKLYVDDLRRCPDGWKIARTITDAISHLYCGRVREISLDHDIVFLRGADVRVHKESFMPVAYFLAVMPGNLRPERVRIHTANVDAGWKMHDLLKKAGYEAVTVVPLGDGVLQEDVERMKEGLR